MILFRKNLNNYAVFYHFLHKNYSKMKYYKNVFILIIRYLNITLLAFLKICRV